MDNPRNSLRALHDSSNRRSQVVNVTTQQSAENAYGGKSIDGYGSKGLQGQLRQSLTNNPSSHRQSRMVGKNQVNSAIEKATTLDVDAGMRNSGGVRNLSLAGSKQAGMHQPHPGTYPSSTKDQGRPGAGTSLVQNLN